MSPTMIISMLRIVAMALLLAMTFVPSVVLAQTFVCFTTGPCYIKVVPIQPSGDPFPPGEGVVLLSDFGTFENGLHTITAITDASGAAFAELSSDSAGTAHVTASPTYGEVGDMTIMFEEGPLAPTPTMSPLTPTMAPPTPTTFPAPTGMPTAAIPTPLPTMAPPSPTPLPTIITDQTLELLATQGQAITETASGKAGLAIIASLLLWVGLRMLVLRTPWR